MKTKTFTLITAALLLSFSSCKKQNNAEDAQTLTKENCHCDIEQAFPNTKGEIVTIGTGKNAIKLEKKEGMYIMGGDMVLTDQQVAYLKQKTDPSAPRTESITVNTLARTWPDGIIYYDLDDNLSSRKLAWISGAMARWKRQTKITFVKRVREKNYVHFTSGDGCSSNVGMTGGKQNITLGNCSEGKAMHEIGHAVGLYHEQTRSDRDQYILLIDSNITDGAEHNFDISTTHTSVGALDFGSAMMYDSYEFSKNGLPTMTKLDGTTFTKQRDSLSTGDLAGITTLYP